MSGYNHYSHPDQLNKGMGRTHTTSSYGSSGGKLFPVSGSTQAIISPAQIELQRANQHIYELQREKDTLKVLLAKYQAKSQINPVSKATLIPNHLHHQRQGSQGTLTTTAGTRSLATELNSQVSGRKRRNSQEYRHHVAAGAGSRERLKHEMIKVKEGMQHLLQAVDTRCEEVVGIQTTFSNKKDPRNDQYNNIQRHTQQESYNIVSKRSSQHQYENPTKDKRTFDQNNYYARDNGYYYPSSEQSDVIQTTSSISSYQQEEQEQLQTQEMLDSISDQESISDNNLRNYQMIPTKKNSQVRYQGSNDDYISTTKIHRTKQPNRQLIAEAESLLNLIKQNDHAFQSFLKMFGSEQEFFAYLNNPSNDNTTALMKIMGLLQELLSTQIKSYNTSSSEQNFTTIPILTQHSLPSQWSSAMTPSQSATAFQTFRRPTSPPKSSSFLGLPQQLPLYTQQTANNTPIITMNDGLQHKNNNNNNKYIDNNNRNEEFFQIDKTYAFVDQANHDKDVRVKEKMNQSKSKQQYDYSQGSLYLGELPNPDMPQRAQSQGNSLNFRKQLVQQQSQQPVVVAGQFSSYQKARLPTFHEQNSPSGGYFLQDEHIDGRNQLVCNTQPDIQQQQFSNLSFITSPGVGSSQHFTTPNNNNNNPTVRQTTNSQNNLKSSQQQQLEQQQQYYSIPNQFKGQFSSTNNSIITSKSHANLSINNNNTTSPHLSSVQEQYYKIHPNTGYQLLNRRNQSEQDLRHRQPRLQLQEETSQYFDTSHNNHNHQVHHASSSMIYNPNHTNNQLSSLNQSYTSQGHSNPPISVKQLVQGFDGINNSNNASKINNVNSTEMSNQITATETAPIKTNGQSQDRQLNTQGIPQSLNSIASNTATPQQQYSSSQNLNADLTQMEIIPYRGSPVKQNLKNNINQCFYSNDNSIITNTASDNVFGGAFTGRSGYFEQINQGNNRQFASMDSSALQSALQTINQFLHQPNGGQKQQQLGDIAVNGGQLGGDIENEINNQGVLTGLQSRNNSDAFDQELGLNQRFNQSYSQNNTKYANSRVNAITPERVGYCLAESNGFYQLPESSNSMSQQSRFGRSIDGNTNKVSPIQSRIGSVQDLQRIGFTEITNNKMNASSLLSGRSLGNSRAGSALRLERSGMLTDRVLEYPRRLGDLSCERTREVAGELRELKQREAILKMQDFGGEIAGLEDKLVSLKRKVQEENRKKEELNREKLRGEQEEKIRRRQQKEEDEKRRKDLMDKERRDKQTAAERKRQRDDQEYDRKMMEIRAEEERIQREKEEEIRRKKEYEEEDRKRKLDILAFEKKIAEEKQAFLLKRQMEYEEIERKRNEEEMQMLERKKQMEGELERVRIAEEQERKRRIQQEIEERRNRQRILEEETLRKLQEFEKEQRERLEREDKERQMRLQEEELIEKRRQEEIERKRLEILNQLEQERIKNKQNEDGNDTNYMKVTEARVSYVRSVQKEYLRRSNSSMMEAAQCSPTKKSLQPMSASINPNWQKVLSKFTNGELEDIVKDDDEEQQLLENKNNNNMNNISVSQENGNSSSSCGGLNGSILKLRSNGRNGSVSPSGKRVMIKDSPTTPKSLYKNNNCNSNNMLSSCGSPQNRRKEAVEELEEDTKGNKSEIELAWKNDDNTNNNNAEQQEQYESNTIAQTFENAVNDIDYQKGNRNGVSSKGVLLKPQQVIITREDDVFDTITEEDKDSYYLSNSNTQQLNAAAKKEQDQEHLHNNMQNEQIIQTKAELLVNKDDSLEEHSNQAQQLAETDKQQLSAPPIILGINDSRPTSKDSNNSQPSQQSSKLNIHRPPSLLTASSSTLSKSTTPQKQPQQQQLQQQQKLVHSKSSVDQQIFTQDSKKIGLKMRIADRLSSDKKVVESTSPKKSNILSSSSRKQSPLSTPLTLTKQSLSSESAASKRKEGSLGRISGDTNSSKNNTEETKKKPALVRKKDKSKSVVVAFGATLPIKSALKTSFASVIATVMDKGIVHHAAFKEPTTQQQAEGTKQE